MPNSFPIYGTKTYGKITQTLGTVIVRLIEPMPTLFTHLACVEVTTAGTAHVLTVMRPLGKTTFSADAAAAQAVVNLTANPGTYTSRRTSNNGIAANDYVVYQCADGTYVMDTVASVATLAITLTTNVPTLGVVAGAPFWFFGITTDTNPADAMAHPQFTLTASVTNILGQRAGNGLGGVLASFAKNDPMILSINNATAASVLEYATAVYSSRGGPTAAAY